MFQGVKFPQGKVVRKFKGGANSLQKIVSLLRRRGYTGYLKVMAAGNPSVGYIVLGKGKRAVALFDGPEGSLLGKEALPRFKELAGDRDYTIEVHTEVDVEPILDSLPLEEGTRSKKKAKAEDEEEMDEGIAKAERKGALEAIGQSLANVIEAFAEKRKKGGAKDVEDDLESLELESVPVEEIEEPAQEEEETAEEEEPQEEEEPEEEEKPKKPKKAKGKKPRAKPSKPAKKDKKASAKKDKPKGQAKKKAKEEEAKEAKEEPAKEPEETPEPPQRRPKAPPVQVDAQTGVLPRFTLEDYIVGDSNRLGYNACVALAEGATEPYNPLLLVGDAGLGKTHLLHAVGARSLARDPKLKVRYMTAGRFVSDLQRALRDDALARFRDDLRALDVLLLDNVQDLDGKRSAQEEILEVFEAFHAADRPLLLASNRRPSEMAQFDSRLVSRFQSGLVVQLKPPELEVRLQYLRDHAADRGIDCPDEVLHHLAESFLFDLRELEGALNRVLAYASTAGRKLDLDLAREALADSASPGAGGAASAASLVLRPARSYLVEEERAEMAYRIFAQRARDARALLITRTNPARLRERFPLGEVEAFWLTDRAESTEQTVEPVLERLVYTVETFMQEGGPGVVMLDGLEYLCSNNGFEPVLKFLRHVVDEVSESDFAFLLAMSPSTLEERELHNLEREMEVVRL